MDLAMMAAAATLLTLSGWHLVTLAQRQNRSRLIERRLREINQQFQPPRPEFKEELRQRLGLLPATSPVSSAPQVGPSTSGVKPQQSSSVSPEGTSPPSAITAGATVYSNSMPSGSDTRGRVWTIGPTPSPTLAWPTPSISTATGGASGVVSRDGDGICHGAGSWLCTVGYGHVCGPDMGGEA